MPSLSEILNTRVQWFVFLANQCLELHIKKSPHFAGFFDFEWIVLHIFEFLSFGFLDEGKNKENGEKRKECVESIGREKS